MQGWPEQTKASGPGKAKDNGRNRRREADRGKRPWQTKDNILKKGRKRTGKSDGNEPGGASGKRAGGMQTPGGEGKMAEYRTLRMTFWNDPYVEELGPEGRLLYLYLITGPYTNNLGVLEISLRRMSYETGLDEASVERLLGEAEEAGKIVRDGSVIWLVNFVKHQASTSPRLVQSLRGLLVQVTSDRIREAAMRRYPGLFGTAALGTGVREAEPEAAERVERGSGRVSAGSPEGEEEGEEKGEPLRRGRFRAPSEEEVRAYCESRGNGVSAEAFVNFYASKGWKVGSSPMRDWRAAVRTWEVKRRMPHGTERTATREQRNAEAIRRAVERYEGAAIFRKEGA